MKSDVSNSSKLSLSASQPTVKGGERVESVDLLRGIASLAVCYLHLTFSLPEGILKKSGTNGALGVQMFFVISGFVIPYSLHRAGYSLRDYGTFIIKRVVRVDPPYLVTIALIIPLGYLCAMTPGFKGPPYEVSIKQVALHLAYLNMFFKENWLNPVFWTLAIEFQYYLLVGLLFPLISHSKLIMRCCLFAAVGIFAVTFSSDDYKPIIFHWLFLFMLGMLTFQRAVDLVNIRQFWMLYCTLLCGICYTLGPLDMVVGGLTSLAILFLKVRNRVVLFFGSISYSLYLIHNPTGVKLVNLGSRFASNWPIQLVVLILGFGLSVAAAFILYKFVEKPAQKWSSAFTYRKNISKSKAAKHPIKNGA